MTRYFLVGLVWLASLVAVGYWQRSDGRTVERSAWQDRENTELRLANNKIIVLEEENRKREALHAASMSDISTTYERRLSDANKQRAEDRAAVRAGGLRLFDGAAPDLRACGSFPGEVSPAASLRDGGKGAELSGAAAEFLLDLVNEADAVVRQLSACQEVIKVDRTL